MMRADKSVQVAVSLRGSYNFIPHLANVWNTLEDLRSASLKMAASGPTNDG
jgi:hypothetical protein